MGTRDCVALEEEILALHKSLEEEANYVEMPSEERDAKFGQTCNEKDKIKGACSINGSQNNSSGKKRKKNAREHVEAVKPGVKKSRKSDSKMEISAEFGEIDSDQINKQFEEFAERNNLTAYNVKNIIHCILTNENVVKTFANDGSENVKIFEPKLTRSKLKEMLEQNKDLFSSTSTSIASPSDTRVLIEGELQEDSSDDEYRPNEDDTDIYSDEESFVSSLASDVGSPAPSITSSTPLAQSQDDDIFKKPLPIENTLDNLIVYHTRSKLPLTDTSLDALERAFVPPDTMGMYDSDCEREDEEWAKFLKEYVCPPGQQPTEIADDEEADPEYNIMEDEEELDREELRADRVAHIPKDEVIKLLSELQEDLFSVDEDDYSFVSQGSSKAKGPLTDILQTAVDEITQAVRVPSPDVSRYSGTGCVKPTGVVQPLPTAPSNEMKLIVSFPTIGRDCHYEFQCPQEGAAFSNANDYAPYRQDSLLPAESKMRLEEQLRMHVQLLTQSHLIAAQQSELAAVAGEFQSMLRDLTRFNPQHVQIANLSEAIHLTTHWGNVVQLKPRGKYASYQRKIIDKGRARKEFVRRTCIHPDRYPFDTDMVRLMMDSRVFIYPQLLPQLAVFEILPGPCVPSVHEEQLIAMGLEQFYPYCNQLLDGGKNKSLIRRTTHQMICHFMLPHWNEQQITLRIVRLTKPSAKDNPIKYFRAHLMAPAVHYQPTPFDPRTTPKLCEMAPTHLPERWRLLFLNDAMRISVGDKPLKPSVKPTRQDEWTSPGKTSLFRLRPSLDIYQSTAPQRKSLRTSLPSARKGPSASTPVQKKCSRRSQRLLLHYSAAAHLSAKSEMPPTGPKRKRGRPRKTSLAHSLVRLPQRRKPSTETVFVSDNLPDPSARCSFPPKKKPGRPRKKPLQVSAGQLSEGSRSADTSKIHSNPRNLCDHSQSTKPLLKQSQIDSGHGDLPNEDCRDPESESSSDESENSSSTQLLSAAKRSRRDSEQSDLVDIYSSSLDTSGDSESSESGDSPSSDRPKRSNMYRRSRSDSEQSDLVQVSSCSDSSSDSDSSCSMDDPLASESQPAESNLNELASGSRLNCSRQPSPNSADSRSSKSPQSDSHWVTVDNQNCTVPNQSRRLILLRREGFGPKVTCVWGPASLQGNVIPVRTIADGRDRSASGSSTAKDQSKSAGSASRSTSTSAAGNQKEAAASGCGGDDGDDKRAECKVVNDAADETMVDDEEEEEESAQMDQLVSTPRAAQTAPSKGRSPAHRLVKRQRNAKQILDSWMADDHSGQSPNIDYAQAYFHKVADVLKPDSPTFEEFCCTIKEMEPFIKCDPLDKMDPSTETGPLLKQYRKIEQILEPHPDLLSEFVLFLGPDYAAVCGKEFQFFLYHKMREFFSKLKIHFKDSPLQLKRALKTLQQVENSDSPTVNDIRNAVLPLLKGNSHLTESFLQLFTDDVPPASVAADFEEVNMEQRTSGDEFEYVDLTETSAAAPGSSQGQGKENEAKSTNRRVGASASSAGSSKSNVKSNKGKGKAWKK